MQGRERRCSIYVSSFLLVSAIVVGITGNWYISVIDIFVIYHLLLSLSLGCNIIFFARGPQSFVTYLFSTRLIHFDDRHLRSQISSMSITGKRSREEETGE